MTLPDGLLFLLFAAISLLSAAAAVILSGYVQNAVGKWPRFRRPRADRDIETASPALTVTTPIRYCFAAGRLTSRVDTNDPFLAPDIDRVFAPTALSEAMSTLHPDLPKHISDLMTRGEPFRVIGYLGADALSVAGMVEQDTLVVAVAPAAEGEGRFLDIAQSHAALLRRGSVLSADAQWTETSSGRVTWCNPAYLALCAEAEGTSRPPQRFPPPRVFGEQLEPPPTDGTQRRCYLGRGTDDVAHWFEVTAMRLSEQEVLCSARSIDKLVTAENSLRDFVQTLSKTFATLPVGLAVFDRKRELVLFNPALVSTSRLDPGFLSRRPSLRNFLDQLRDMQRMPEPRDYRTWRDEISVLEQNAEQDRYHEIWTLPGGETLRVTGRPHPNGAIAFLFEDISEEVSLTRRFRTDLDLDHAIRDDFPAGIVVFDRDGEVRRTNEPYRRMLGLSEESAIVAPGATMTEMARIWQDRFHPSGLWGEIRQFARHETDRAAWSEVVSEKTGARLHCRIAPLRGGNTIVWFLPEEVDWSDLLSEGNWPLSLENPTSQTRATAVRDRGEDVA